VESILSATKYDDNVVRIAAMSAGSHIEICLLYYRIDCFGTSQLPRGLRHVIRFAHPSTLLRANGWTIERSGRQYGFPTTVLGNDRPGGSPIGAPGDENGGG
jgi:hypothetical protein